MENQHVNNDKGNWCKRLRSRKGTASLEEGSRSENNRVLKGEQRDRKISAPSPPKKQQNQCATDTAECTPMPLPDSSSSTVVEPQELKTSEENYKGSSPSAPPPDASGTTPSGLSPHRPEGYEDIKHTALTLPKSLSDPNNLNGVFTCVRCKLYTKDIGTFLQHKHNVQHEPPLSGDAKDECASQSDNLNNYLSLASTGPALKYEYDSQMPPQNEYPKHTTVVSRKEKERKYNWRNTEIQPKLEDSTSPGLKLRLTKNPLKANSWMARGYLSLSGEGMLDENGLLLKPEKTLEATNQYLERTIVGDKSGKSTLIKEELKNLSRPVTPVSLLLPKNGTLLPPESINPNNNELAVLMEKNNISIPPNCTTKVQGFKMVDGKKHLVLKVIPAAKQEITDIVELPPSSTEGLLSNSTNELQNLDQSDPACSVEQHQPCNGISAHEAISTCSPVLGETHADSSPLEKSAHGQCEDQGFCDGPNQGCEDNHSLNQDETEDSHKAGDDMQISAQEVTAPPMASESHVNVPHEADQISVNETNGSVDVTNEPLSPAPEEDSSSEADGGFPVSQSPPECETLPASPCQPCGGGKEHSHTDDGTVSTNARESHVQENNADGSEASGKAESVKSQQGSAVSIQTTCLQNNETSCSVSSPDVTAQPIAELRIAQAPTGTEDAVEEPYPQVPSPQRTETAVNNKRPRDSSPDLQPASKAKRDEVDSEEGTVSKTSTEAGCWEPSPRHAEKTLRLFPVSCFQLIKKPQGEQPVVVLNHPDADIPEVANIMRVVHKYGNEVQKVVLCQRTVKALSDFWGDGEGSSSLSDGVSPSPLRVQPRNTVKERFSLKLKLRRSGQNAYQVVNAGRQQSLRCWFCGRVFTNQEDFICHGQRHLMEANSDWRSGWFKSQ